MRARRLKVEKERKKRPTPEAKSKPTSTTPGEEVGEMTFGYEEEF